MIFSKHPIFSTYSHQTNSETRRETQVSDRVLRKKTYRLLSKSSKKDPNSAYNRIKRLEDSDRENLKKSKLPNLRLVSQTPDYSEVKSRIDTFRDYHAATPLKVTLHDKVRNELLLKKNQVIIRTMTSALRTDEKAVTNTRPETDASFQRQVNKILNQTSPQENTPKTQIPQNTKGVIQKKSEAFLRNLKISQSQWLKKRGFIDPKDSITSSKDIFAMLDTNKVGEIPAEDFLDFLIEIGIPIDRNMAKKVILSTLKQKNIKNLQITQENVNSLCKSDKRSNLMLKVFQDKLGKNFKTLDVVELIQKWWNELGIKVLGVNAICEFLVKNEIFPDFFEAKKYLAKANQNENFLVFRQFLNIFAKMIVKHYLITINKKFSEEEWSDTGYSLAFKLCQLKKQLILAGIKYPVDHISYEEGLHALKAIEDLDKFKLEKKFNFDEFKLNWYNLTGFTLDNQTLIKQEKSTKKAERPLSVFYSSEDHKFHEDTEHPPKNNQNLNPKDILKTIYNPPDPNRLLQTFKYPKKKIHSKSPQKASNDLKNFQNLIEN